MRRSSEPYEQNCSRAQHEDKIAICNEGSDEAWDKLVDPELESRLNDA
jgi:hypothetical protein